MNDLEHDQRHRQTDHVKVASARAARWAARVHLLGRLYNQLSATVSKINALRCFSPVQPQGREIIGTAGSLEIRLARGSDDLRDAQRLRYDIFYKEMSAIPSVANLVTKRDIDHFDSICDHLLVVDHELVSKSSVNCVVATYRLLRQSVAEQHGGFYTSREFNLAEMIGRHRALKFLELGRACVHKSYRSRLVIELLWHGIYAYAMRHRIDALIGCASFDGMDPDELALPLSYLHHYALAPEEWQIHARPERYVEMNRLTKTAIEPAAALRALPTLIRGYLRLGARVGCGAVIDRKFRTTDIAMVLPASAANFSYLQHWRHRSERH
jgi:L-ornithine Nalpha-acyltransferase